MSTNPLLPLLQLPLLLLLLPLGSTFGQVSLRDDIESYTPDKAPSTPPFLVRETRNSRQCHTLCLRTTPCLAFTFRSVTSQCQLYHRDLSQGQGHLVPSQGALYRELCFSPGCPVLTDGCDASSCPDGFVCVTSGREGHVCLKVVDCGSPPARPHSEVRVNSTTVQSQAVYRCDAGRVFVGSSNVSTCNISGVWVGPRGECQVDCGPPTFLDNATVLYTATTEGATAHYRCFPGHVFTGSSDNVTCGSDAEWTDVQGACAVDCGPPTFLDNATVLYTATTEGATAHYRCFPGHVFTGSSDNVTCGSDAEWTDVQGACAVDCGIPARDAYHQVNYSSTVLGSQARLSCCSADDCTDVCHVICQPNGVWQIDETDCSVSYSLTFHTDGDIYGGTPDTVYFQLGGQAGNLTDTAIAGGIDSGSALTREVQGHPVCQLTHLTLRNPGMDGWHILYVDVVDPITGGQVRFNFNVKLETDPTNSNPSQWTATV